jgi:redox-sensitive bicupin YhaK (pirin superfamily)
MEIITIPLDGALEHKYSMDNIAVVAVSEIQVMSAGTVVSHSEYNKNKDQPLNLLQHWVLPNKQNVVPRYDQKNIKSLKKTNALYPVITPNHVADGMWIHQDAWFHLGDFNQKTTVPYSLQKKGNGVYAFMIEGRASIEGESLEKRDALGVWETESFSITAEENSRILLVEVPMKL